MRTFTGEYRGTFRVVVTEDFIKAMRRDAQAEGSSGFLQAAQKAHPTNDEAFIEMVVKNGLRQTLRLSLADLIYDTAGMGGTVSPATISIMGIPVDAETPHVEPHVINVVAKDFDKANEVQA